MRAGRRPDDPRRAGPGGHLGRVPEGAPTQGPHVGELRRQPQRRLGTGRDGPRARRVRRARLRGPRLQDAERRPARRGEGDPEDELAGHPPGLAGRPHLGHDRVPGGRRSPRLQGRQGVGCLRPRPLVSAGLEHLGPVRSAGHLPGRRRDGAQLPQVAPAGGPLQGPRRPLHLGRADAQRLVGVGRSDRPDAADQEDREQRVLGRHAGRVAERDGDDPERADEGLRHGDDHAEAGERGDDLADRVVGRIEPARERVGERVERDGDRERRHDARGQGDVVGTEEATTEQHVDEDPGQHEEADRRGDREEPDGQQVPAEHRAVPPGVPLGVCRRQDREHGQREGHPDQADGQDLVVAREVQGADAARPERRRQDREVGHGDRFDRVADHPGHHQPDELPERRGPEGAGRPDPERRLADADRPDPKVRGGAGHGSPRRRVDPEPPGEQDRPEDDPEGIQDRRQRVEREPAVGHEDLAERE